MFIPKIGHFVGSGVARFLLHIFPGGSAGKLCFSAPSLSALLLRNAVRICAASAAGACKRTRSLQCAAAMFAERNQHVHLRDWQNSFWCWCTITHLGHLWAIILIWFFFWGVWCINIDTYSIDIIIYLSALRAWHVFGDHAAFIGWWHLSVVGVHHMVCELLSSPAST